MANEVEVQTFLDGFDDPLFGYIRFDSFEDPLLGLQKLEDQGEVTGRAVGDPRRGLEATPDIEEAACFIAYRRSNRLVDAFRESRPFTLGIRKVELDGGRKMYQLTFRPD
jgi:hypothetical protein